MQVIVRCRGPGARLLSLPFMTKGRRASGTSQEVNTLIDRNLISFHHPLHFVTITHSGVLYLNSTTTPSMRAGNAAKDAPHPKSEKANQRASELSPHASQHRELIPEGPAHNKIGAMLPRVLIMWPPWPTQGPSQGVHSALTPYVMRALCVLQVRRGGGGRALQ